MRDKLSEYNIREEDRETILEDFKKVLIALDKRTSKPYHIGSYDYFILRLASRRGIEIKGLTKEKVEYRESREMEQRVEESVKSRYRGLSYNKKRTEEMWDKINAISSE